MPLTRKKSLPTPLWPHFAPVLRIQYLKERREALGGYMPSRDPHQQFEFEAPPLEYFQEWLEGSRGRAVSTTMAFVSLLRHLLKHEKISKLVVPIVPDEARTFGMESI